MTDFSINIWGEFSDSTTERAFLNHNLKARFLLNRICILVSGIGYLFVVIGDFFRIGFCPNVAITAGTRFLFFIYCISVFFILKYRLEEKLFRNLTFLFVIGNTLLLLLLIYFLNPDKQVDRIDELTLPFITLMLFMLTQLSVKLLFINGVFAFVSYIAMLALLFKMPTDYVISLVGLLSVLILSGLFLSRYVQKSKRLYFTQTRQIEQLNKNLNEEVLAKNAAQLELLKTHNNLIDSIEYAKNLQLSFLPTDLTINQLLSNYFIFFHPCNIVSGDFYWVGSIHNKTVVVVADCTGHGVPAAFMSILGITLLNKVLKHAELDVNDYSPTAASLLDELKSELLLSLNQNNELTTRKEGMDIALCIIDKEMQTLQFAGAYSDLWLVTQKSGKSEIFRYKGDKMPIGVHVSKASFLNHQIALHKNDMVYLFTDGIIDQFGGERNKRFMRKQFCQVLLKCQSLSIAEQEQLIRSAFFDWKQNNDQIDDVLVMGIQVV